MTGDHIIYDFVKKKGEIVGAEVKAFPWFAQAGETKRVGDNEYLLRDGFVTTCDLDEPHYRIAAQEIRMSREPEPRLTPARRPATCSAHQKRSCC